MNYSTSCNGIVQFPFQPLLGFPLTGAEGPAVCPLGGSKVRHDQVIHRPEHLGDVGVDLLKERVPLDDSWSRTSFYQ